MKFKRGSFRSEDLVSVTDPIYRWGCPGCYAKLTLKRGDPRASGELAPRCDQCGSFMAAFNDERDRSN